jgi:hypothetical protein
MRILNYLYGKKSVQIFELIEEKPEEILPILENRIVEKVNLLEKVKKEFTENNWKNAMKYNYYKALDVKSNSIKSHEKDKLVNKNLINELKTIHNCNKNLVDQIFLTNTIENLFGREKERFFDIKEEKEKTSLWNPVIAFEIGDKKIMNDIADILTAYVKIDKMNKPNEGKKYLKLIRRLVVNYFQINGPQKEQEKEEQNEKKKLLNEKNKENPFKNLKLEEFETFQEELTNVEKLMKKEPHFYYSDKYNLKILDNKIKEMIEILNSEEKEEKQKTQKSKAKVNEVFNDFIHSNSSAEEIYQETQIKQDNIDSKIFFGSYPFYIFFRYFVFIYERFQYAYELSQQNLKSEVAYNLFKKVILYYLFGAIDYQNFEDILKMIFGSNSGVFLNFDKIFSSIFKIYKSDDFSKFVFNLNKFLFEQEVGFPVKEDVLFAKSCYKFNNLMAQNNNRNYKSSSINSFNNNYQLLNNELLKFQYIPEKKIFIIHIVKSIFHSDGKDTLNTFDKFLEAFEKKINKDNCIKGCEQKEDDLHYVKNNVSHSFTKSKLLNFNNSGREDIFLNLEKNVSLDDKHKTTFRMKKIKKFKNLRNKLFEKLKK